MFGRRKKKSFVNTATLDDRNLLSMLGIDQSNTSNLSEATYFACLKVLSESIGKLPLRLLRQDNLKGIEKLTKEPWYYAVKYKPNPYMNATTFWSTVEMCRNEYGNAYAWINRQEHTLWILDPKDVTIYIDDANVTEIENKVWYIYKGVNVYTEEEILHFKTSTTFDGISGKSVAEQLKSTIKGAKNSQAVVNNSYENNMVGKTIVQYTGSLSDDLVKNFVDKIRKYTEDKTNPVLPVPIGTTVTPLNTTLVDSQFFELKQFTALQIASAFGIKPYQIGDYTKSSYASAEAQQLSFYVDTLLYIVKQYEEELTGKLLTDSQIREGWHFKFNVNAILRADFKTQLETVTQGVMNFVYTPNEGRALLDLPAVENGDKLIGNGATIPLDKVGNQYRRNLNEGGEEQ